MSWLRVERALFELAAGGLERVDAPRLGLLNRQQRKYALTVDTSSEADFTQACAADVEFGGLR